MLPILSLLSLLLACGGKADPPPPSDTQLAFLDTRSRPVAFVLGFSEDEDGVRRVETWFWTDRWATFDSGFFVEEGAVQPVEYQEPVPNPVVFHPDMSKADLEALLGEPGTPLSTGVDGLEVVPYSEHHARVSFYQGELTGMSVGLPAVEAP